MTACERLIASIWPPSSALFVFSAVTSVAYFTTLVGVPSSPKIGLYDAWIQTSRPSFPNRLNSAEMNSPSRRRSQNLR